jgi:hypothetical protein
MARDDAAARMRDHGEDTTVDALPESVVIEHLLKLQFSPATDPKAGWIDIAEHRRRLEVDITPRLEQILLNELPRVYRLSRGDAERVLRRHRESAAADALPEKKLPLHARADHR